MVFKSGSKGFEVIIEKIGKGAYIAVIDGQAVARFNQLNPAAMFAIDTARAGRSEFETRMAFSK